MAQQLRGLQAALADRYAIERELGAGGMATVYLAEDLRHRRKVAVKVLREDLAATLGTERFHREIQIAAQLQHPNILPLLDSGEAAGLLYYVMPYVEGQSVRERLAREGALPVGDAVRILRDVVDALTEAHAHGVVHRDIKPENIMLRGRHALVTDFGVAKAVSEATGQQTLTTAGVALGTPAYMAPEQASADPHLDHRVDIYAVGAVGYELLTGRPVFMGTTPQMVLAAHVTEAPVPVTRYRETVPRALEALVMRCLEKRPADRWQSAAELLAQLEVLATPSGGITPTQTQPVTAARARRYGMTAGVLGAGAAVVVAVVVVSQILRSGPLSITVSDITPVTSQPGVEFQPAISPDGREIAFVAGPISSPRLVIRAAADVAIGGEVRPTSASGGHELLPAWSPDGNTVRFQACRVDGCSWSETGRLGGAIRTVGLPPDARAPAWSPDGTRVAFAVGDTIFMSSTSAPDVRRMAVIPTQFNWRWVHSLTWSPDGKRIALVEGNSSWQWSGNVAPSSIWVVDVARAEIRHITSADHLNVSPVWLDARRLLFVSNRDGPRGMYLVEVGSGGARREPRIVPGVADPHSIAYSIAARRLVYAKLTLRQNIWSYPLGRATPVSIRDGDALTTGSQVIEDHDVSPDGKWLAHCGNLRGNMDLYKVPLAGGEPVPLTGHAVDEFHPRWSPDGREIAFYRLAPGSGGRTLEIATLPVAGGAAVSVGAPPSGAAFPVWSPSGRGLAFTQLTPRGGVAWLLSRDSVTGPWHEAVQVTDFDCYLNEWAPDGSGVLCTAPSGSTLELVSPEGTVLWRREIGGRDHLRPITGAEAQDVRYARDGSTLYLAAVHEDGRSGVWALPVSGGEPRLIVAFDDPAVIAPGYLSVGPDRLYLTVAEYESDIWVARLDY